MHNLETLVQENLGWMLSPAQSEAFNHYESLLLEWNQKFNLTAINDPDSIRLKHFYDSLTCLKMIPEGPADIIDIGCGAGFPGIPLKIVRPDLRLTLVESVGKKADFCSTVVQALHLKGVTVLHARAEDLGQDAIHRERYDWAVARAVAPLPVLAEYLLPLVKLGGAMLAQKGSGVRAELDQAANAIALLGGRLEALDEFELPLLNEKRTLVKILKEKATPRKYPRKAGLPSKKPLV